MGRQPPTVEENFTLHAIFWEPTRKNVWVTSLNVHYTIFSRPTVLLAVRTVERLAVFLPASCSYLSVTRAEQIAGTISDCNKIILNIFARCCDGDYEANKPQRYELSPDLFLSVRRQLSVKAFSQRRPASEGKHITSLCFGTNTAFNIQNYCYCVLGKRKNVGRMMWKH